MIFEWWKKCIGRLQLLDSQGFHGDEKIKGRRICLMFNMFFSFAIIIDVHDFGSYCRTKHYTWQIPGPVGG